MFVLMILFLFSYQSFSYDVKWVKQPEIDRKGKVGALKTQTIYGMFFSKELPIKKIVTITNTEIISKAEKSVQCEDGFFFRKRNEIRGCERNESLWREGR